MSTTSFSESRPASDETWFACARGRQVRRHTAWPSTTGLQPPLPGLLGEQVVRQLQYFGYDLGYDRPDPSHAPNQCGFATSLAWPRTHRRWILRRGARAALAARVPPRPKTESGSAGAF